MDGLTLSERPAKVVIGGKTAEDATSERVREFLRTARKRWKTIADAESALRTNQLDDKRFVSGDHWPAQIKADREADGRPCLTINRLPQFTNQVLNQARQSRPAIQVSPVDDGSDPETAEVFQGLIRHIETQSQADVAYLTAADDQVKIGRGYWRVLSEYADETGFEQQLRIRRVRNPFTVYMDVAILEVEGSDARCGFIIEDIPTEEYEARFPGASLSSLTEYASVGDEAPDWMPEGKVRVAEYWYVEETRDTLVSVEQDGQPVTYRKAVYDAAFKEIPTEDRPPILATREVRKKQVKWAIINAVEILEGNEDKTAGRDWPGQWIPIVPVIGYEIDLNGQLDLRGMVRDGKDIQRAYDYWVTAETEAIALAPRVPFIGAEGQFEADTAKWNTLNRRNYPYVQYSPKSVGGQLMPPPQRDFGEPPIQAINAAIHQTDNDFKSVMGLFDPSLGAAGPEQSGRAILARQKQGELANSHFLDNLGRAIRHTGRILVDLIPHFYDTPRVVRILGLDEQPKLVMVYAGEDMAPTPERAEAAKQKDIAGIYDLGVGRYDVTVSVGPSYASRRQEAVDAMVQFVQSYPNIFPMIGDLLAKNMDWPGAREISERLKKLLPEPLQERPTGGPPPVPPEIQTQMQQMGQAIQQLQQALGQAQQVIQSKQLELASQERLRYEEIASRERIAAMEQRADLLKIEAQAEVQQASTQLKAEIDRFEHMTEQWHERLMAQEDRTAGATARQEDRRHAVATEAARRAADARLASEQSSRVE